MYVYRIAVLLMDFIMNNRVINVEHVRPIVVVVKGQQLIVKIAPIIIIYKEVHVNKLVIMDISLLEIILVIISVLNVLKPIAIIVNLLVPPV